LKTQADKLKSLVESTQKKLPTRVIAITSGKGGVGKSTISANLGYVLHDLGFRVALFDADIGLANLDVLLRVNAKKNIFNVLKGECELRDIAIDIEDGFVLIPGESGEDILKYANEANLSTFFSQLDFLKDFDFFIIDTSAGIDSRVQTFLDAADDVIVVTVPEPAAITDAYAMIKLISEKRDLVYMILNEVSSEKEARNIFKTIFNVANQNIDREFRLQFLGFIQKNKIISTSSIKRELFVKEYPHSAVTNQVYNIAKKIAKISERKVLDKKEGITDFFRKIFANF